MSSCCTNIRSYSPSVSRCYYHCKTCLPNQRTTENVCLESSPKKTCRIIITNFLLSFSIYLVSLSFYTKLVYKFLFKRHLIFVANVNPMFFLSLHSLEAPLHLTLQQLAKLDFKPSALDTLRLLSFRGLRPLNPLQGSALDPAAFYTPTTCGRTFGLSFSAPPFPNTLRRP